MASLNGFKISDIVQFEGQEGTCWQGQLSLDNENVLFWSDDMNGGPLWYRWKVSTDDKERIENKIEDTVRDTGYDSSIIGNVESLIALLMNLRDIHREWENDNKDPMLAVWNQASVFQAVNLTGVDVDIMNDAVRDDFEKRLNGNVPECRSALEELIIVPYLVEDFRNKYHGATPIVNIFRNESDFDIDREKFKIQELSPDR